MAAGTGKARALIKAFPLIVLDVFATIAAYVVGAWGMNIEDLVFGVNGFAWYVAVLAFINVVVFAGLRMYNSLWKYASVDELIRVVLAVTVASAASDVLTALLFGQRLPWRCYIFAWLTLLLICGSVRFAIRVSAGSKGWSIFGITESASLPRTLIIGAGEVGSLTVKRMLSGSDDMKGCPVGLVDDTPSKQGSYIHGIKVVGTCADIPHLCTELKVEQLVVAIPSATKAERDVIYSYCVQTGLKTLTYPLLHKIDPGAEEKPVLREVQATDLLAREEVLLDMSIMGYVTGKRVMVTGGGGSIGSELVRQLLLAKPAQIIVFDIYENTTYELFHDIVKPAKDNGTDIRMYIGSITHMPAINNAFQLYRPHVVFHAAAHKHVPLMERNAREAIENNIFGTLNVMRLADQYECTHFVQISTDKAVNPANVMGATKRFDEMLMQYFAATSKTIFTAVRFGNVLGSHGSVIPLFKQQMAQGGPVTITHKDITRYFMTIPEASRLVITAGALAKGGEIFVLDMGEPVKIWDLAVNLITLSGLKPGEDIEIKVTGLRPGEKLYEELLMEEESLIPTSNSKIRISMAEPDDLSAIQQKLDVLESVLDQDNDQIKRVLSQAVPTYTPEYSN